ncbi:hypothetical protein NC653_001508 [Populus alba x Populus x berolinensis]|uniref:Uncharacterized protein n=1 Tax=Populus alba x Populus x berolinensis TaxID=444605 RepID=A0AAD6RN28_9ROSI|nr:hypothetical protein NC653_001508 [Populus alba x Populus x berolinensis]
MIFNIDLMFIQGVGYIAIHSILYRFSGVTSETNVINILPFLRFKVCTLYLLSFFPFRIDHR